MSYARDVTRLMIVMLSQDFMIMRIQSTVLSVLRGVVSSNTFLHVSRLQLQKISVNMHLPRQGDRHSKPWFLDVTSNLCAKFLLYVVRYQGTASIFLLT